MGVINLHTINKQILKIIRDFVDDTKLTMSEVAREAGISKAWISRLTNDTTPNMSIETASSILNVAGYELVIKKVITAEDENEVIEAEVEQIIKKKPFSRLKRNYTGD